jgi:hypothetical protein
MVALASALLIQSALMKARLLVRFAAALAAASAAALLTPRLSAQNVTVLQKSEAPADGFWLDSLDLSNEAIRRPRLPRGQTGTPPPLKFALGGAAYAHALPLVSDGDVAIALGGTAWHVWGGNVNDITIAAGSGSVC